MSVKVPTVINDKNGKKTTVHKNPDKEVRKTRDIGKITTPPMVVDSRPIATNPVAGNPAITNADSAMRERFANAISEYGASISRTTDPDRIIRNGEEATAVAKSLAHWKSLVSTNEPLHSARAHFETWLNRHINEESDETESHRLGYRVALYYLNSSELPLRLTSQ